jgi:hypothetical protein
MIGVIVCKNKPLVPDLNTPFPCVDPVSVGLDEEMVREYIRQQEKENEHYDQLKLGMGCRL